MCRETLYVHTDCGHLVPNIISCNPFLNFTSYLGLGIDLSAVRKAYFVNCRHTQGGVRILVHDRCVGCKRGDREEVVEGKGRRWEGQVWDGLGVVGEGE